MNYQRNSKALENKGPEYMIVFEQCWAYIRHVQTMFWQSFAALFSIAGILALISEEKSIRFHIIGVSSSVLLSIVGIFITIRAIIVIREHFTTINKIRKHYGMDEGSIIPKRWKRYKFKEFKLGGSETLYIFTALIFYILLVSLILSSLANFCLSALPKPLCFLLTFIVFLVVLTASCLFVCRKLKKDPDTSQKEQEGFFRKSWV